MCFYALEISNSTSMLFIHLAFLLKSFCSHIFNQNLYVWFASSFFLKKLLENM